MRTLEKVKGLACDLQMRVEHDGWRRAGGWLLRTLVELPYYHADYAVFARSLLEPLPTVEPRLPVTLRLATEDDLVRFTGVMSPSEVHHFTRRLAHGRYCFLALDEERLAAYCWASTEVRPEIDDVDLDLRTGDAYLNYAYTVPAYRRQGIQAAVHVYRLRYIRDLGCKRAVLIVSKENVASQALVSRLGYQDIGRLEYERILWKRTWRWCAGEQCGEGR